MKKKDLLSKYVQGTMSEKELDDITKMLVKDHFEEMETKEKWKKILDEKYGVKSFESLDDWNDFKEKKNKSRTRLFYLTTLSTLVASLLIFVIFTLNTEPPTSDPLGSILSEEYNSPVQYRNSKGVSNLPEKRILAFDYYNNKDYQSAAKILETIVDKDAFVEDDYFYLGLSYLYLKKAMKASTTFKYILEQENLQREDATTWFLALSLIENKEYPEARKYLNEVAKWEGNSGKIRKANQAKELLSIIETF